ncbi:MAG: hypothetical protein WDM86_05820 [Rhizomicrobium sp.]
MTSPTPAALDRLEQAQDIVFRAWEASSEKKAKQLAEKALKLSPLCADAYVLLAECAPTADEALDLWRRGVEAGAAALGRDAFEESAGDFWAILETRPYMRARAGLSVALWRSGRADEAIAHQRELLRLNPNDNQGNRYILAAWLAERGLDAELEKLLKRYRKDASAVWTWLSALLAFRRDGGDAPKSRKALDVAFKENPYVAPYLLGDKALPDELPPYYAPGEDSEAIIYAEDIAAGWKRTPGALDWLRAREGGVRLTPPRRTPSPPARRG